LPVAQSYPSLLEKLLQAHHPQVTITNAGVSGDTSAQALKRIDWVLQREHYDLALLCIGANDGLRLMPTAQLEKNLEEIVKKFKAASIEVILIGMKMHTSFDEKYRLAFERAYSNVAKKEKLKFYPFILEGVATGKDTDEMLHLEDQIHPNSKGYAVIAKRLDAFLTPILNSKKYKK
jgi:acyl-CoA thioesterase I